MIKRHRILHVISELNVGGTELHLVKLLPHLQKSFDNQVACLMGHGPVGDQLMKLNIPVHYLSLNNLFDPRAVIAIRRLARNVAPRVIVANLLYADIVTRLAIVGLAIPLISSQRSSLPGRQYLRFPDRILRRSVNHYVVQTPHMRRVIEQYVGIPSSLISVIPNAVTPAANLRVLHRDFTITCVSNLRPSKGHACLIRAIYHLKTKPHNIKILLVGDGPEKKSLRALTKRLEVTDQVRFLGLRHDVSDILARTDVFVLPSEAEGMSNALLEAMAIGLPCLASNIPANQTIISHRTNGLLFAVNDDKDLAANLAFLIANPASAQNFGSAAQNYALKHHDPIHISEQWRKIIDKITV